MSFLFWIVGLYRPMCYWGQAKRISRLGFFLELPGFTCVCVCVISGLLIATSLVGWISGGGGAAVFLFLYFIFMFFTKIYYQFGNLQKYTPAVPLPAGRDLAARQPGGRGLSGKKRQQKIADRSLETGRPAAGRPAPRPPGSGAGGLIFCNLAFFAK